MLLLPVPVQAETLQDALARAYLGNPTLNAARAQQRATDEQVPQALSGWRPSVTVNGSIEPTTGQSNRETRVTVDVPAPGVGTRTVRETISTSLDETPGNI